MRGHKKRMKPQVAVQNNVASIENECTEEIISINVDNAYKFPDNDLFNVSFQ